jgi:hypothetical protein
MCLGSVRGEAVDVYRLGKSAVGKDDRVGDIYREVVVGDAEFCVDFLWQGKRDVRMCKSTSCTSFGGSASDCVMSVVTGSMRGFATLFRTIINVL